MRLQPNIGSDRSWVWKVAADYSEQPPTSETLAIRFANSDSESCDPLVSYDIYLIFIDATSFKTAFEDGQKNNVSLVAKPAEIEKKVEQEEKKPEEVAHTDTVKDDGKAEKEEVKKEEEEEVKTG